MFNHTKRSPNKPAHAHRPGNQCDCAATQAEWHGQESERPRQEAISASERDITVGQGGHEGVLGLLGDGAVGVEVEFWSCGSVPFHRLRQRPHAGIANLVAEAEFSSFFSTPVAITLLTATASLSVHFRPNKPALSPRPSSC